MQTIAWHKSWEECWVGETTFCYLFPSFVILIFIIMPKFFFKKKIIMGFWLLEKFKWPGGIAELTDLLSCLENFRVVPLRPGRRVWTLEFTGEFFLVNHQSFNWIDSSLSGVGHYDIWLAKVPPKYEWHVSEDTYIGVWFVNSSQLKSCATSGSYCFVLVTKIS